MIPGHSMLYGMVQQFPDLSRNFAGLCDSTFNQPTMCPVSPDPFSIKPTNPKRLILRPHVGSPATTYDRSCIKSKTDTKCGPSTIGDDSKGTDPQKERPKDQKKIDVCCQDDRNENGNKEDECRNRNENDRQKHPCQDVERPRQNNRRRSPSQSSTESSRCDESSTSEESLTEAKKKLRARVGETEDMADNRTDKLKDVRMTIPGQNVNVLMDGKAVKIDAKKNAGSYVRWVVDRGGNSSVEEIEAIGEGESSIDDRSARNFVVCIRPKSDATTERVDKLKLKPMAEGVCRDDDVFENAGAGRFTKVKRAEPESGYCGVDVLKGNESTNREETTIEIPVTEKPLKSWDNQSNGVFTGVKATVKTESAESKRTENNFQVESDVFPAKESVESEEGTAKFVKMEPTNDRDEGEEIAPCPDSLYQEASREFETGERKDMLPKAGSLTTKATLVRVDPMRKWKKAGKAERSNEKEETSVNVTEDAERENGKVKLEKMSDRVLPPGAQEAETKNVKSELVVKLETRKRMNEKEKARRKFGEDGEAAAGPSGIKDELWEEERSTGVELEKLKVASSNEMEPRKDVYKSEWAMRRDPSRHIVRTKILKPFEKSLPLWVPRKSKDEFPERK